MELAFLSPSPMELAVIAVIALLVLGPSRLPEAARSLGKGMKEMRDSFSGAMDRDDDDNRRLDDDDDEDEDLDEDADYAPAGEIDLDEDKDDEPTAESDDGASRSADGASSSDAPAVKTA